MTLDWNAIRLDLLQIDEPTRATLREMRPFIAKTLPGILARFYDKVRNSDPACGIFKDGVMQEAIRLQLEQWDLLAAGDCVLREGGADQAGSGHQCRHVTSYGSGMRRHDRECS